MKRVINALLVILLLLACEGKQGPMGPPGPEGPEGPSGAAITFIYGVISSSLYDQGWIDIEQWQINDEDIIQVYLSPDSQLYTWGLLGSFMLDENHIYIYDPDQDFLLFDYMIKIIHDTPPV